MKLQKILLVTAGCLLLGLGAAGIVLPGLPAAPFLLAASFCFMKSSRRLHNWLMGSRFFGPRLERLKRGAGLTAWEKLVIYLTACAGVLPVIVLTQSPGLRLFLAALLLIKAAVFLKMKTAGVNHRGKGV